MRGFALLLLSLTAVPALADNGQVLPEATTASAPMAPFESPAEATGPPRTLGLPTGPQSAAPMPQPSQSLVPDGGAGGRP